MGAAAHHIAPADSLCPDEKSTMEGCLVFGEGDDLYAAMLEDIGRVTQTIRLDSYVFRATRSAARDGRVFGPSIVPPRWN